MSTLHGSSGWAKGDDFTNNFIADLGPLLSLFGEQVAKQFMSESMGWADNIIFAMGPLGIITAIVGAIRVGGPSWLKAIIGRARENRAVAEVELMSSTSHEVCELWNGQQIVRIMGSPEITELIHICGEDEESRSTNHGGIPMYTLELAKSRNLVSKIIEESYFPWCLPTCLKFLLRVVSAAEPVTKRIETPIILLAEPDIESSKPEDSTPEYFRTLGDSQILEASSQITGISQVRVASVKSASRDPAEKSAPNISLNIHDRNERRELHTVALIGTVLQVFVVIYGGFATYHPRFRYQKEGSPISIYAFPLTSIGTLFLVLGLLICSHVIERSTTEENYQVNGTGAHVIWLQKNATVGDQEFESYAIFAKDKRNIITTSRRNHEKDPSDLSENRSSGSSEFLAVTGTVVTLCGFFGQFIGFRAMHWSVTFTQLGVTLVMVILRAWVRRGLAKRPYIQLLPPKHEIDWLATRFTYPGDQLWRRSASSPLPSWRKWWYKISKRQTQTRIIKEVPFWSTQCFGWEIVTGGHISGYEPLNDGDMSDRTGVMHDIVQTRKELGWLTKWPGSGLDYATSVAAAIDHVMNTLFTSEEFGNELSWTMNCPRNEVIRFKLQRSGQGGKWSADIAEIEATLSLWLYTVREKEQTDYDDTDQNAWLRSGVASKRQSLRLLGGSTRSSRRDMRWWMGSGTLRILQVGEPLEINTDGDNITAPVHRVVGFSGRPLCADEPRSQQQVLRTYKVLQFPEDLTDDLSNPDEATHPATPGSEIGSGNPSSGRCRLSLAALSEAPLGLLYAQDMFSAFMWAAAKKLDRETIEQLMGKATIQQADITGAGNVAWQSFTLQNPTLSRMMQGVQRTGLGSPEEVALSIIPPLSVEKRLPDPSAVVNLAREEAKKQELAGQWGKAGQVYLWAYRTCMTFGADHAVGLQASISMTEFIRSVSITAQERKNQRRDFETSAQLEDLRKSLSLELKKFCTIPFLSKLASMYEMEGRDEGCHEWKPSTEIEIHAGIRSNNRDSNFYGLTHLHQAILDKTNQGGLQLPDGEHLDTKDIFGWTPLHYAVHLGDSEAVAALLKRHANPHSTDSGGWSPLHYVAWSQSANISVAASLMHNGVELNVRGGDGLSPLHCAAIRNNVEMVTWLIRWGAKPTIYDNTRKTPLHWAALRGSKEVVDVLKELPYVDAPDDYGRTPLHLAASNGHDAVVRALLDTLNSGHDIMDHDGFTPILLAAKGPHLGVVKVLLSAVSEEYEEELRTALYLAVKSSNIALVKELLDTTDRTELLSEGGVSLHLAVSTFQSTIVKALLKAGVDKEFRNEEGCTALLMASKIGNPEIVSILLGEKADKDARDPGGLTALHLAAIGGKIGHLNTMKVLLDLGAYKEAKDQNGWTPLHLVSRQHQTPNSEGLSGSSVGVENDAEGSHYEFQEYDLAVQILAAAGADIESKDDSGYTALHLATSALREDCIFILLWFGANIEAKNNVGQTALHLAVENKYSRPVLMLLSRGADVEAVDANQKTPIYCAAQNELHSIVEILLEDRHERKQDIHGCTALHWAAGNGITPLVKKYLDQGVDRNQKDINGCTALHWAAWRGYRNIVYELVSRGLDQEAQDNHDELDSRRSYQEAQDNQAWTALHWAAWGGHSPTVELLLGMKVSVNVKDKDGYTALHHAALGGFELIVGMLLDAGAEKNMKDGNGRTALHWAAWGGDFSTVELLLSVGASVDMKDVNSYTPLHYAALAGKESIVEILLRADMDIEAKDVNEWTALHHAANNGNHMFVRKLLSSGADSESRDKAGCTALHRAAERGGGETVDVLLDMGAYRSARSNSGSTPLQHAAFYGQYEAVDVLICAHARISSKDHVGTALHYAAFSGHESTVEALLDAGANPHEVNKAQWSPLHFAAYNGHGAVANILVQRGANLREKNTDGHTALYVAFLRGHLALVEEILGDRMHYAAYIGDDAEVERLLNSGISPSSENILVTKDIPVLAETEKHFKSGKIPQECIIGTQGTSPSALHYAASNGHETTVKLLLKAGANINQRDPFGQTALHYAAANGQYGSLGVLLENGANAAAETIVGWTALHTAAHAGHIPVVDALLEAGAAAGVDIGSRSDCGSTALHLACDVANESVIRKLLEAGADVNARTECGGTALHRAVYGGREATMKELLGQPNAGIDLRMNDGSTALHVAARIMNPGAVKQLVDAGASLWKKDSAGRMPIELASLRRKNDKAIDILLRAGGELQKVYLVNELGVVMEQIYRQGGRELPHWKGRGETTEEPEKVRVDRTKRKDRGGQGEVEEDRNLLEEGNADSHRQVRIDRVVRVRSL